MKFSKYGHIMYQSTANFMYSEKCKNHCAPIPQKPSGQHSPLGSCQGKKCKGFYSMSIAEIFNQIASDSDCPKEINRGILLSLQKLGKPR